VGVPAVEDRRHLAAHGALALAVLGLLPRGSVPAAWTVLGACVVVSFMGPLLGLPGWVSKL
jgi:putative exporter of polyketide antibiotics